MPNVALSLRIDEKLKRDLQALCKCYAYSLNSWVERELQYLVEGARAELPRELNEAKERVRLYNELAMKVLELGPQEHLKPDQIENGTSLRDEVDRIVAERLPAEKRCGTSRSLAGPNGAVKSGCGHQSAELSLSFVERQLEAAKRDYKKLRDLAATLNDASLPCLDIVDDDGLLTAATRERILAAAKALGTYAEDLGSGFGYGKVSFTWTNVLNRRATVSPAVRARIAAWLEHTEHELAKAAPVRKSLKLRIGGGQSGSHPAEDAR